MMNHRMTLAIALGLLAAACSRQPAVEPEANGQVPAATPAETLNADDDTLEVAPPVINEGEEHDESKAHTH